MKRVVCCLSIILLLIAMVFCIPSYAAATELIDSVDINAYINADGTVNVTEKWIVSYVGASDKFFRNIDVYTATTDMSLIQEYDEIKDVKVKIDGKDISVSKSGINTYSFAKTENGESYEIVINCPSAQITREYEISYTVTGAVKKHSGDANFSFVFIGKTFAYTSNNVSATVHFPDGTEKVDVPKESEGIVEGNSVTFSSKRVYDTFEVEVYADDSVFNTGALAAYSAAAEGIQTLKGLIINFLPWIIAVLAAVVIILFVLFSDRLTRISAERKVKKLLKTDEKESSVALPRDMTACEAYKMLVPESRVRPKSTSKKVPALFAMAVLECMEKGYIKPDDNKLIVGVPANGAPAYILSVLNFLKTFCEKKGNRYIIDSDFADKVASECMTRYDVIANYLATFYKLIPETNGKFFRNNQNKEKYENAYILKVKAAGIKNKPTFAQCMGDVLSGRKTGEKEVFSMLLSSASAEKLFDKGGRSGEKALCEAINAMYKVFIKSK